MKKILLTIATFFVTLLTMAQSPNLLNYQGVARNGVGNVLPNQPIGLRLSILTGGPTGAVVYSETRTVTTNAFGLFNVQVGSPGAITTVGTVGGINWTAFGAGSGTKFLQVEIDANGGTNYFNVGSTQLLSVPYALNAAGAAPVGPAGGDLTGTYPNPLLKLPYIRAQADAGPLFQITNSGAGNSIEGLNTGTGRGGYFVVNNAASTSDAIRAETNGTGASWGIRAISSGTNGGGLFQQTNATNTANNLQSTQAGLGRAGLFTSSNAANAANALEVTTVGTGYALRAASTNAVPLALQTAGGIQHTGIGEALNFILRTDAAGNATWVDPAVLLPGANFWSRTAPNLYTTTLTDNVGIGVATPAYKLEVVHGGATGIKSRSTASFSVVDIDAINGDAALRFQNAGIGQWNIRNRPGDNYLEFFELGSASRMVIQDATGNVGIGNITNPAYRLDVQHGGATGIRSQSTASFSVVDIDANNGDAALRFQSAGVGQWNIRNRPADNYLEIFELGGGGSRMVIQDATGNVGIGNTTAPAYKLDVLHGGATGIRSQSSATFSVVDIDAANGDAALRFQSAGVGQWNTRNRPADNYYEIFELGGGGSRVVIQDGTGNVGIGQTVAPAYKLDVLHGGATGIRSQSSATFSVVDIDAANGDAALRFQSAGVGQWNTRNNPATDDYQIFELGGGGERMRIENTTGNVVVAQDFTVVGVKAFTMDHPLDPANKLLRHAAAESNEVINFYSGNIVTDASGKAVVSLPDYFEAINKDFRYQLTVVGGTFAQAIISKEVSNNKFEIATNQPNVKVSWEVKGVRNDARMKKVPFVAEQLKTPDQKGKYFDPASYNLPLSRSISYSPDQSSSLQNIKQDLKVAKPESMAGTSLEPTVKTVINKVADKTGSVLDVAPVKTIVKPVDNSGSVAPEVKKEQPKPLIKPTEKGSTEQ